MKILGWIHCTKSESSTNVRIEPEVIPPEICGYRLSMGTITELLEMGEHLQEELKKIRLVSVYFMDISAVFDTVPHVRKLKIFGYQDSALAWVDSYTYQRGCRKWEWKLATNDPVKLSKACLKEVQVHLASLATTQWTSRCPKHGRKVKGRTTITLLTFCNFEKYCWTNINRQEDSNEHLSR